jgi:predicted transposase YdaD
MQKSVMYQEIKAGGLREGRPEGRPAGRRQKGITLIRRQLARRVGPLPAPLPTSDNFSEDLPL